MSELLRWVAPPGGAIILRGEPLLIQVELARSKQPMMSFTMVPRGVGEILRDLQFHANAVVETKEGVAKAVSCTFVPPKTIDDVYASVIDFVEKFSDDPVCAVLADALREGMQPKHEIAWLDRRDVPT